MLKYYFKLFSFVFLIATFGLSLPASADFDLNHWAFSRDLFPPSGTTRDNFVELPFDSEIFANSRPDLADLRLIRDDGLETPYAMETAAANSGSAGEFNAPVRLINQGYIGNEATVITADLGRADIRHTGLVLTTSGKNFRREVLIEGSNDNQTWLALRASRFIYDYTLEFTARDTAIHYSEVTSRYLRVTIYDRGEKRLIIAGALARRAGPVEAKTVDYPLMIKEQIVRPADRQTIAILDLGSPGLPTHTLIVTTANNNFNRPATLEGSDNGADWRALVARDVLFAYATPTFTGEKLTLAYPESRYQYLRLTIKNGDDTPLRLTGATAAGTLQKLIFRYEPAHTYQLYFGRADARRAEYDLASFISYFSARTRLAVSLGPKENNPQYIPPPPPHIPFSERSPYLLVGMLILTVLVIGGLTFRLFKQTQV